MPFDHKGNYISVAEWKKQMGIGQQPTPAIPTPEAQPKKPGLLSRVLAAPSKLREAIGGIGKEIPAERVPEAFKVAMGGYEYATKPQKTLGYKLYEKTKPIAEVTHPFLAKGLESVTLGMTPAGQAEMQQHTSIAAKVAGTAGELAGAMLPIGVAAGVAGKLIPAVETANRVVNILRSGARLGTTGALYGGAEAIVQGQPVVPAAAKSAAMFAAGGGLGGAVGKGIEKVAPKLAETIPGRVAAALPRGFATGAGAAATQAALAPEGQKPTWKQVLTEGGKLALYEAVTAGLTGAPAVRPVKATEVPRMEEAKPAEPVVEPPKAEPVEVKKPGVKAEQVTTKEVAATRPERPITAGEAAEARPYRAYPIDKGTLWIDATNPEDVRYFYEDPTDRTGASGGIVRLPNGSLKRIEGAWSSRPEVIERLTGLKLEEYVVNNMVYNRIVGGELRPPVAQVPVPTPEAKAARVLTAMEREGAKVEGPKVEEPAPIEAYHGTSAQFERFEKSAGKSLHAPYVQGFFFTEKPEIAERFAYEVRGDSLSSQHVDRATAKQHIDDVLQRGGSAYVVTENGWKKLESSAALPDEFFAKTFEPGYSPRVIKTTLSGRELDLRNVRKWPAGLVQAIRASGNKWDRRLAQALHDAELGERPSIMMYADIERSPALSKWMLDNGYSRARMSDAAESGYESLFVPDVESIGYGKPAAKPVAEQAQARKVKPIPAEQVTTKEVAPAPEQPTPEAKAAELKTVAAKQHRKATKAKVVAPAETPQPAAPLLDVKQGDTVLYPSTFPKDAKPYKVLGVKGDKVTLWDGKIAFVTERDTISRPGASPDQAPAAEAKPPAEAASSAMAAKEPWQMTKAEFTEQAVQRIEEPTVKTRATVEKPHGVYTTPLKYESPHKDLGGQTYLWLRNPDTKVLEVPGDRTVRTNRGRVGQSAGIGALRELLGEDEAQRLLKMDKERVVEYLKAKYPDIQWGRYYDAQEALEGYAGLLARQAGYDAIYQESKYMPELTEYVGLTDKALRPVTSHEEAIRKALAEGRPVPAAVLADYPDLAAKAAEAKPPAEAASSAMPTESRRQTLIREAKERGELVYSHDRDIWQMGPYQGKTAEEVFDAFSKGQNASLKTNAEAAREKAAGQAIVDEGKRIAGLAKRAQDLGINLTRAEYDALVRHDPKAVAKLERTIERVTKERAGEAVAFSKDATYNGRKEFEASKGEARLIIEQHLKGGDEWNIIHRYYPEGSMERTQEVLASRLSRKDAKAKATELLNRVQSVDVGNRITFAPESTPLSRVQAALRQKVDEAAGGGKLGIVPESMVRPEEGARGKESFTSSDPEVEARIQASHGIKRETWGEKFAGFRKTLWVRLNREFEKLPHGGEFSEVRNALLKLQKQRGVASDTALRMEQGITMRLQNAPEAFHLFERKVLLDDLAYEASRGHDLPYGYTDEILAKDRELLDDALKNYPEVQESLNERRAAWDALRSDYATAMESIGLNVGNAFSNPDYFRHQVIEYANAKGLSLKGAGNRLRTPANRSFLKKRAGSSYDINSDYLQAEHEVMAQMLHDIEVAKVIRTIADYDISPRLKAEWEQKLAAATEEELAAIKQQGLTWRSLLPDGHRLWQPREGNVFYLTKSLPEKLAEEILSGQLTDLGVIGEKLNEVLAVGGPRWQMALKNEIADTLDNLPNTQPPDKVRSFLSDVQRGWKVWTLINPKKFLKYNFRNLSGDAEAVWLGNPSGFKKAPQAAVELARTIYKNQPMTPEMREWFSRGGMESTLQAQEMGDIDQLSIFTKLFKEGKSSLLNVPANVWNKYWRSARLATDYREAILRYANYLDYLEQMQKNNGRPLNFGASDPEEVMALRDIRDRAYKLSNDLLGAYDQVSIVGQTLRKYLIPFWSWQEVNFKRYTQLIKNAVRTDEFAQQVGRKAVPELVAKGSVLLAKRAGVFALKALALSATLSAYNNLIHPDEERDLPDNVRKVPHITFGRDKDGNVLYFSKLGMLSDFLSWFGASSLPNDLYHFTGLSDQGGIITEWLNGHLSPPQAVGELAKEPVNVLVSIVGPQWKTPAEIATGKKLFPDVFKPGTIRDKGLYIAETLGLGPEYRIMAGLPKRSYLESLKDWVLYSNDPYESAYYDILDEKARYMAKIGKGGFTGATINPKATALYNLKLAMRYGDQKAFLKYLAEYANHGGTAKGLGQSLRALSPLYGMTAEDQADFINGWLDDAGREKLRKAYEFHVKVLLGVQGKQEEGPSK